MLSTDAPEDTPVQTYRIIEASTVIPVKGGYDALVVQDLWLTVIGSVSTVGKCDMYIRHCSLLPSELADYQIFT